MMMMMMMWLDEAAASSRSLYLTYDECRDKEKEAKGFVLQVGAPPDDECVAATRMSTTLL